MIRTLLGFLFSAGVTMGIPYIGLLLLRLRTVYNFPIVVLFQWVFLSVFSTQVGSWFGYGAWQVPLIIILASACTIGLLIQGKIDFEGTPTPWKKILLFSFIAILDGFLLFYFNSWGVEQGSVPTIRAPFNNDAERNLVLVNALIRGDGNPFLQGSRLIYQSFWHRWAALFVAPFDATSNYTFLAGCNLFTLFFFYVVVFCFLARKQKLSLIFLILIATHAEVLTMLESFWQTGFLRMEADWSVREPMFYRYVSTKLLGLIAPQHLFFLSLIPLFFMTQMKRFLIIIGFLVSPILSVLTWLLLFPAYGIFYLKDWKRTDYLQFIAVGIFAFVVYGIVFHQFPWKIFSINRADEWWVLPAFSFPWWRWFLVWPASIGLLSLLVLVGFLHLKEKPAKAVAVSWIVCGVLFNLLITNAEIRRHGSMIMVALSLILVVFNSNVGRRYQNFIMGLAFFSLPFHLVFLYRFSPLHKNNEKILSTKYSDYFQMNDYIKANFKNAAVYAASSVEHGVGMPLVAEVATTFVQPLWARVHGEISPEQATLLASVHSPGEFLKYAREFGYLYVIVGPIEEEVWGKELTDRIKRQEKFLIQKGWVGLFLLGQTS